MKIVMAPVRAIVRGIVTAQDRRWYSDQTIEDSYSELARLHESSAEMTSYSVRRDDDETGRRTL